MKAASLALAVLLMIVGAVGAAWWFLSTDPPASPPLEPVADAREEVPEVVLDPAIAADRRPSATSTTRPNPHEVERPAIELVRPQRDWSVVGRIQGLSDGIPVTAPVVARLILPESDRLSRRRPRRPPTFSNEVGLDGTFEISLPTSIQEAETLEVTFDDPLYLPCETHFQIRDLTEPSIPDRLGVEWTTQPTGGLTGRVIDTGTPVAGVPVFLVSDDWSARPPRPRSRPLLPQYSDQIEVDVLDRAVTTNSGTYYLRAAESGAYRVVALPPGRPVMQSCALSVQGHTNVPDLFVRKGVRVAGAVKTSIRGVTDVGLEAVRLEPPGSSVTFGEHELDWFQGQLSYRRTRATTNKKGEFEFPGLEAAHYELVLGSLGAAKVTTRGNARMEVTAPADDVTFVVEGASTAISLAVPYREHGPLTVTVSGAGSQVADRWRQTHFLLATGQVYEVEVTGEPFLPSNTTIRVPANANHTADRITLELPPRQEAILDLELEGKPVRAAGFRWQAKFEQTASIAGEETSPAGRYTFHRLIPGCYQVWIHPTESTVDATPWIPAQTEWVIGTRESERKIRVSLGGLIQVDFRDSPRDEAVDVMISDPTGRLEPQMNPAELNGPRQSFLRHRSKGSLRLLPPLREGIYWVHVQDPDNPERIYSVDVQVTAGQTTTVPVHWPPSAP